MAIIEDPRKHLPDASFIVWKRNRVILQFEDAAPPMESAEVVAQDIPAAGRTMAPWKGELAQLHGGRGADLIVVQEEFCLTDW